MVNKLPYLFNRPVVQVGWIPLILFAFALILRIWEMDSHPIQLDEPFSLYHSSASILDIFKMLPNENNPPLHFLILHFWIELFGIEPFPTRLLSAIFSSFAVVYTYFFGKEFLNHRTGIAAAFILCLSNLNIVFAHEVRVYSLFTLLAIATAYYYFKMLFGPGKTYKYPFILSSLLLIYSHFFGLILLAGLFLIPFSSKSFFFTHLKSRMQSFFWIGVFYLPYSIILLNRFFATSEGNWVPKPNMSHLSWGIGLFTHFGRFTFIVELILFVYVLYFILQRGEAVKKGYSILLLFSFCYFSMFFASSFMPMFIERYLVYLSPFFYLSLFYALFRILNFNRIMGNTIAVFFLVVMGSQLRVSYPNSRQPNEAAKYISQLQSPRSATILIPKWWELNIAYHYDIEVFKQYGNSTNALNKDHIYPIYGGADLERLNNQNLDQILFVDGGSQFCDPDSTAYQWCHQRFTKDSLVAQLEGYKLILFYEALSKKANE